MSSRKRKALIVMGMHRSGTSALGGVLTRLGAAAPKTLMPPTPDNPRGYVESVSFMKFHDEILASSGSRWNDWGKFNPDWYESHVADEFREELPQLLEDEFGDARLFVLKDPRICRFFPFWVRACQDLDIAVKVVIPIRHPLEVAQSLHTRDRFGSSRALLMWLRHMLDAEHSSRDIDRSFLRYSDLLEDWRGEVSRLSQQLQLRWPRRSSQVEVEIDGYLESELRRQRADVKRMEHDGELMSWIKATSRALDLMVDNPSSSEAQGILDGIRTEFDRTAEIYGAVVHEELVAAESSIEQAEKRSLEASSESERMSKRASEALDRLATLLADAEQLRARIVTLDAEVAKKTQLAASADRVVESLTKQVAAHSQAAQNLRARLNEQTSKAESLTKQVASHSEAAQSLRTRLTEQTNSASKLRARLTESEEEGRQAQARARQLEADIGKMTLRVQSLESDNLRHLERNRTSSEELAALSKRMLSERLQAEETHVKEIARADEALRQLSEAHVKEVARADEALRQLSVEHAQVEASMQSGIRTLEETNTRLTRRVEEMMQSTSWRVTAPARGLSTMVRVLFGRRRPQVPLLDHDDHGRE